jgi:hypothetical protein
VPGHGQHPVRREGTLRHRFYDFELDRLRGFDELPEKNVRYGVDTSRI